MMGSANRPKPKTGKPLGKVARPTTSVSPDFVAHVQMLLDLALREIVSGGVAREGLNGYSRHALPAYISAVVSLEAFVNECFLGEPARRTTPESALWGLPAEWLERLDLWPKLALLSQLLFGVALKRDEQPWRDLRLLTSLRNDLVHYKMKMGAPSYMQELAKRKIPLAHPLYAWTHAVSTSEGIRWANNTVCKVVRALVDSSRAATQLGSMDMPAILGQNFREIDIAWVKKRLEALDRGKGNRTPGGRTEGWT